MTEQGISMIDFCLYGYGYYLFDAAGAALIFNRGERDIFLSGYTKQTAPLTEQEIRLMEGFMLILRSVTMPSRWPTSPDMNG